MIRWLGLCALLLSACSKAGPDSVDNVAEDTGDWWDTADCPRPFVVSLEPQHAATRVSVLVTPTVVMANGGIAMEVSLLVYQPGGDWIDGDYDLDFGTGTLRFVPAEPLAYDSLYNLFLTGPDYHCEDLDRLIQFTTEPAP